MVTDITFLVTDIIPPMSHMIRMMTERTSVVSLIIRMMRDTTDDEERERTDDGTVINGMMTVISLVT